MATRDNSAIKDILRSLNKQLRKATTDSQKKSLRARINNLKAATDPSLKPKPKPKPKPRPRVKPKPKTTSADLPADAPKPGMGYDAAAVLKAGLGTMVLPNRSPSKKNKLKVQPTTRAPKLNFTPLPHTIEGYDIETGRPAGDDPALTKSPLIRDSVREGYKGPFKISTDTEDYDVGHKRGGKVGRGKKKAKARKRAALRGHRKELRGG